MHNIKKGVLETIYGLHIASSTANISDKQLSANDSLESVHIFIKDGGQWRHIVLPIYCVSAQLSELHDSVTAL